MLKQLSKTYPVEFQIIEDLLKNSEALDPVTFPVFLENLSNATVNLTDEINGSPYIINDIVRILSNVADASYSLDIIIEKDYMENILITAGSLTTDKAKDSWEILNNAKTRKAVEPKGNIRLENTSSSLLNSLEIIASRLVNKSFNIATPNIQLNKTTFTNTFAGDFMSSIEVELWKTPGAVNYITIITFASMDNVLPSRDKSNSSPKIINGKVVLLRPETKITNVSLTFDILNNALRNPKCVFWEFNLFEGFGGWSDKGCMLLFNENETIGCSCNHTTSFSILMSPHNPDHSELVIISFIGVGFSIVSLIICLIIEGILWKTIGDSMTSYFRHISIINIAVSLLIANIWFIIVATIPKMKNSPVCTSVTFFIHFFYLALFFWMLASALLLLYRMINVFDGGLSKMSMLAIGFSLGYGAPLIIATITIAVTAPSNEYIRNNVCWLNWKDSEAMLGFVIPALLIVGVNLIILFVVISKMLMRRVSVNAAQAGERHVLMVIVRSLAVLTPFFGLTWGLGYGTMFAPENRWIHIAFAFFNSLQGFFILMFGTLSDKNARSAITVTFSRQNEEDTTGAESSHSLVNKIWKLRRTGSSKGYHQYPNGSND
ncbi:LOW QUALITY PROTEIN: adhesion G-protein coupled receptor F1-like [Cyprinodon tularosa]|uniref:LOW QUALITY PROTEIN: adhesion G-protein coupled receptor F1-like n=1 Tax=Cyprinodon tularosa TaxID=77115 RepID=UPI0018E1FB1F|nr:LOW QUALITY PROTEIN: adhesion G-protein coupled receptor F1-like [Cyprinodon tularosa]